MSIALPDLLRLPWKLQADHLRSLAKKDLEILWFQVQLHEETLNQLKLAVFSILRDLYEHQGSNKNMPERVL